MAHFPSSRMVESTTLASKMFTRSCTKPSCDCLRRRRARAASRSPASSDATRSRRSLRRQAPLVSTAELLLERSFELVHVAAFGEVRLRLRHHELERRAFPALRSALRASSRAAPLTGAAARAPAIRRRLRRLKLLAACGAASALAPASGRKARRRSTVMTNPPCSSGASEGLATLQSNLVVELHRFRDQAWLRAHAPPHRPPHRARFAPAPPAKAGSRDRRAPCRKKAARLHLVGDRTCAGRIRRRHRLEQAHEMSLVDGAQHVGDARSANLAAAVAMA